MVNIHIDYSQIEHLALDAGVAAVQLPALITLVEQTIAEGITEDASSAGLALGSVAAKATGELSYLGGGEIEFGGEGWDLGAEFGAKQYPQFQAWTGNDENAGYFLYPTVRKWEQARMDAEVAKALMVVLQTLAH